MAMLAINQAPQIATPPMAIRLTAIIKADSILFFILASVASSPNRIAIDGKSNVITRANPTNHFTSVVDELGQCTDTTTSGFTIFIIPTPTYVRVLSDVVPRYDRQQSSS